MTGARGIKIIVEAPYNKHPAFVAGASCPREEVIPSSSRRGDCQTWREALSSLGLEMLSIPDIAPFDSTYTAALAYAEAGWYVLPVDLETKKAGSILGNGWHEKSMRDPQAIGAWFDGNAEVALALHVGRSGAVVFDVDDPEQMPTSCGSR